MPVVEFIESIGYFYLYPVFARVYLARRHLRKCARRTHKRTKLVEHWTHRRKVCQFVTSPRLHLDGAKGI